MLHKFHVLSGIVLLLCALFLSCKTNFILFNSFFYNVADMISELCHLSMRCMTKTRKCPVLCFAFDSIMVDMKQSLKSQSHIATEKSSPVI